jgi:hypothetical protein
VARHARPDAHNYDPARPTEDGRALDPERGETRDIFLVDRNGGTLQLTDSRGNDRFPDWRP